MPIIKRSASVQPTSVVTGAAGFLGSHLTDLLLARGHKVIGIDNFVTGAVDNISHLGGNRNFKFIDRKSTRLNSSHSQISYAVFCLQKKKNKRLANSVHAY